MTFPTPMKIDLARRFFFIEDEGTSDGFARENWRGGVLNRDKYGWHAMPRVLWDGDSVWWICGYVALGEVEPDPTSLSFDWDSFLAIRHNPARDSPEWVAYNDSQTIAVLAEFDATIVGAKQSIADELDRILRASNTSLRQLTSEDFEEPGRLDGFLKSVMK